MEQTDHSFEAPDSVQASAAEEGITSYETTASTMDTVYAILEKTIRKELTASDGNTYEISVTYKSDAEIPVGAELEVQEILEGSPEYEEYHAQIADIIAEETSRISYARLFDISIVKDGEELNVAAPVDVKIQLKDTEKTAGEEVSVLHFGEETEQIETAADDAVEGEMVSFKAQGFSVYAVVYTVDFHWGEYTYNLASGSGIYLSELLGILGTSIAESAPEDSAKLLALAEDMSQINNVTFSDPELLKIEKQSSEQAENDWLLTSLAAFDSEEKLTLALADGEEIVIRVTDAAPASYKYYVERSNGTNGESFNSLEAAVASVNSKNYACNLYIGEDCTLSSGITFTNTHNYAVNIYGNGHTITRGAGANGNLITYNRTAVLTIDNLKLDGGGIAANGSLLKTSTGTVNYTNFTAQNNTASNAGVCAVDASAATGEGTTRIYSAKIIGNTAAGKPANLKINNTTCLYIYNSLTQDIGITSTNQSGNGNQFGYLVTSGNTGMNHLKNDISDYLYGTASGHTISWMPDTSKVDDLDVMFGFPNVKIDDLVTAPTSQDN